MRIQTFRRTPVAAMVAALLVASPQLAMAQSSFAVHEARWQPWLGCWTPTGSMTPVQVVGVETLGSPTRTMVCVVPGATPTSVEIINFAGGAVVEKTIVDPARSIAKTVDACSGAETSKWSADGRRLLMRGEFVCTGGVKRVETGIMSMDVDGQWVQAQSVTLNGKSSTFVARFKDTGIALEGITNGAIVERPLLDLSGKRISPPRDACTGTESVTPSADGARVEVKSDYTCGGGLRRVANASFTRSANGTYERVGGPGVLFGSAGSRAYAGAEVSLADVLEVAKAVDVSVAEAWVADRGQQFPLSGKELVRLADNGMPGRVVDLMVAMANPRTFSLRRAGEALPTTAANDMIDRVDDRQMAMAPGMAPAGCAMAFDYCYGMMGMGWLYGADRYYGWSPLGWQFNRFGFGNGFGFANGGFWGPGYFAGNGPIVVVNPASNASRGRAVYGQGYTRGSSSPSSGFGGAGRTVTPSAGTSSGGSSGGASGGSSGGGSSSGRTAKPRGGN